MEKEGRRMVSFLGGIGDTIALLFGEIFWYFETIKSSLFALLYAIGSLLLMLLDFVQSIFRKLAGLDTYYYNGTDFEHEDILQRLLTTPEILQAMGALIVVGLILLFIFTIVQFIRVEYTTEGAKNSKGNIIKQSLKSLAMFVIVPLGSLVGIFLSNKILQILDNATKGSNATIAGQIFKICAYDANPVRAGESKYAAGGLIGNATQSVKYLSKYEAYEGKFSFGSYELSVQGYKRNNSDMINTMATIAKLQVVATGETEEGPGNDNIEKYTIFEGTQDIHIKIYLDGSSSTITIKSTSLDPTKIAPEYLSGSGTKLANNIDEMFSLSGDDLVRSAIRIGESDNAVVGFVSLSPLTTIRQNAPMNYTNPLAVYYFYNLQDFSFFLMYIVSGFALMCLFKAAFGMVMRLYMCAVLFIISPPIIAMSPLDNGKALGNWKSQFIGQVLAGYGTVVGLNVFLTILPIIKKIELFGKNDFTWAIANDFFNGLVQVVFVLVGCYMLKDISKTISGLIGAKDAMESGEGMAKQVTAGAAKIGALGMAVATGGASMAMKAAGGIAGKIGSHKAKKADKANKNLADAEKAEGEAKKDLSNLENKAKIEDVMSRNKKFAGKSFDDLSDDEKADALKTFDGYSDTYKKTVTNRIDKRADIQEAKARVAATGGMVKSAKEDAKAAGEAADREEQNPVKGALRKFSKHTSLGGARFATAAMHNITGLVANSGAGKFVKGVMGDMAPTIAGGKGISAYDNEISGQSDAWKQLISQMGKAKSKKADERDAKKGWSRAAEVDNRSKIAQDGAGQFMKMAIDANAQQQATAAGVKQGMQEILNDFKAGIINQDEAKKGLHDKFKEARDSGALSNDALSSLASALANFNATGNAGTLQAEINNKQSFETKMEVAMKDPGLRAQIEKMQRDLEAGKHAVAVQAAKEIKRMLANRGVQIAGIDEIMEKLAKQASQEKASEKDLKQMLAILQKLSK